MPAMRWPFLIALAAAASLVIGVSTARETYHVWQVDQEIKTLQAQVDQMQGQKSALMGLVQKLGSSDTLDQEARARLGLRKEGERVIILHNADGTPVQWSGAADDPSSHPPDVVAVSNPQKWFSYFFSHPESL